MTVRANLIHAFENDVAATQHVLRGVCRHLRARGYSPLPEFALGNSRRADIAALDEKGNIIIVEIKVSLSDFRGDAKWTEYLGYCDQFYFAVPHGYPTNVFDLESSQPDVTGLIVADRFDAAILRDAPTLKIAPARRKAETLRFARKAALRLHSSQDPNAIV